MKLDLTMYAGEPEPESGSIMIAFLATILPLVLLVGTASVTMTSRNTRLMFDIAQEKAFMAAESGLDEGLHRINNGTLVLNEKLTGEVGAVPYAVEFANLKTDELDNDGDDEIDEEDEDVIQMRSTGVYQSSRRTIVAYLKRVPVELGFTPNAAVSLQNPGLTIQLDGSPRIDGHDTNVDGTAGPGPDEAGLAITDPGTTADLLGELTGGEPNKVDGDGGTPSLDVAAAFDFAELVTQIRKNANLVLTEPLYSTFDFGDGTNGDTTIAVREGDLMFDGISTGAGILLVTGNLEIAGTFRYDGLVIVLGDIINSSGTASIYGAIAQGPAGTRVELQGNSRLYYSSEAVELAEDAYRLAAGGPYYMTGWQETSSR
jgi:hypothetical protein